MYKEGRQFVVDAKKEIDGVVKDVKQAQNDVKGIWAFFTGLFSSDKRVETVQPTEQPKKKVKQKAPEFDENKIYADVADALT